MDKVDVSISFFCKDYELHPYYWQTFEILPIKASEKEEVIINL